MGGIIGYAPGVYDLFHVGHLNVLRRAKQQCDLLIAGVVADDVVVRTKGFRPVIPLKERLEIVRAIDVVDRVYAERTTDKLDSWQDLHFDRIFKGEDWRGTERGRLLEQRLGAVGVEVVYFPYTLETSSTQLRRALTRRVTARVPLVAT